MEVKYTEISYKKHVQLGKHDEICMTPCVTALPSEIMENLQPHTTSALSKLLRSTNVIWVFTYSICLLAAFGSVTDDKLELSRAYWPPLVSMSISTLQKAKMPTSALKDQFAGCKHISVTKQQLFRYKTSTWTLARKSYK